MANREQLRNERPDFYGDEIFNLLDPEFYI